MGSSGVKPTHEVYAGLMWACLEDNDLPRAIQVMDIVRADGVVPGYVSFKKKSIINTNDE